MMKRQIIGIFLIFFIGSQLLADLPVISRLRISRDMSGRDAEYLRGMVRQIDRLRRRSDDKLHGDALRIVPGQREFAYTGDELFLPGDASRWESDRELRCRILGVLASRRLGVAGNPEKLRVFPWMCAGLDDAAAAAGTMGKYIAGNSTFPLLSSFYIATGRLPDFAMMCKMDFPRGSVWGDFAAEQARLLLEIFAGNGRLPELFAGAFAGEKPDFWLRWYSSKAEAVAALDSDARQYLWNRYSPLPPDEALEMLREAAVFPVPELDADGKPTGQFRSGDIGFLHDALKTERPDAGVIRENCADPFRQLAITLTIPERQKCMQIAGLIRQAGMADEIPEKFIILNNELSGILKNRRQFERFLRDTLDLNSPPAVRLALPLDAVDSNNPALSTREKEFFARQLDLYIR